MKMRKSKGFVVVSIALISLLFLAVMLLITTFSVGTYNYTLDQNKDADTSLLSLPNRSMLSSEERNRLVKYTKLKQEEAFLKVKNLLMKEDSIVLIISIPDSSVSLSIKGMNVHTVKASKISFGGIFNVTSDSVLTSWLSTPFRVESYRTTVIKEQIFKKIAPKDEAEANAKSAEPEPIPALPVYYSLYCNKGLEIDLFQSEIDTISPKIMASGNRIYDNIDVIEEKQFLINQRKYSFGQGFRSLLGQGGISYRPWIELNIPQSDALIIFRATPHNCKIALKFR